MWGWLKKQGERNDIYQLKERLIYSYFDGHQQVKADPLLLWRRVMDVAPVLQIDIKLSESASKDADKGLELAVAKIRDIFQLKTFEDGGLTHAEACGLLDHFLRYCNGLKKNLNPLPTRSKISGDSPATSRADPVTPTTSDCGSTANGCSTGAREPLPTGSVLPLEESAPALITTER